MSFAKLPQIALYIVIGISVLVVGFFYFGDNLIDAEAYQAKVEKLNAPAVNATFNYMQDLQATETDSLTGTEAAQDTAASLEDTITPVVEEVAEPVVAEEVTFTFMEKLVDKRTDIAIIWSYILVVFTLVFALGFSLIQMFSHTKTLVRGLILLAGVAVLVGIAYMLGSDTPLEIVGFEGTDNSDPQVLKLVDMGLISSYFVLGMIVIAIFYSEIAKYFK